MTCIVGLVEGDRVFIGGDAQGSAGDDIDYRKDNKVFLVGDMVFGFSGSYRMGQVIRYHFNKPQHKRDVDTDTYLHREFIPAIITLFNEHGVLHKKEEVTSSVGLFLLGYRGRLFCVDYDFQIAENIHRYDAIGSGGRIAKGALYIMTTEYVALPLTPEATVHRALMAAAHHSATVGAPYTVAVTP